MAEVWNLDHLREVEKKGYNPITGREVTVKRRRLSTVSIDLSDSKGLKKLSFDP